ncbi:Lytic transglycosylase catalytic [Methylobacterium sp. 4-46]|uniref:lytic transglycosylase domain-containing protein n=1 Tax=unclassified Methylobacterium TaxID=2615210 RepID=UPI000165CA10|nr:MULTISPECIES: lytic transglycosylase domain-containing protein [Methylobacterium]ACA16381.1 Lytic transglycosylase catalytic [Methylobacterium sp. 4-46]WFT82094.1 lytic transglycosylase domain-containing protein [Methylobacterium nodulans]
MIEKLARVLLTGVIGASLAAAPVRSAPSTATMETVGQALCRLIESSARARGLPVPFLTRLIWRESGFRTSATSSAGAQGVAQFMPGTSRERGLSDPFDPEQAIPHAAHLLADLRKRFGNLGLAAAAYNGGPTRVANWLAGSGSLPAETRAYVHAVTGRAVEEWRAPAMARPDTLTGEISGATSPGDAGNTRAVGKAAETGGAKRAAPSAALAAAGRGAETGPSCAQVTAGLRVPSRPERASPLALEPIVVPPAPPPWGPWGVQLAGNFSKEQALESFVRTRSAYAKVIGEARPMIIGTRLLSRGGGAFYRVRIPAQSQAEATALCGKIRTAGGACLVLKT